MNVLGIGSASSVLNAYGSGALQPTSGITNLSTASAASQTVGVSRDLDGDRDSTKISPMAQMLSKLQQLKAKDPNQFKQVLSDIAGKLQTLSQQQGQDASSSWLAKLAARFQTAAQTGDLSGLQPKVHHHRHSAGASAYGQTDSQGQQTLDQIPGNGNGASPSSPVMSQLSTIFSEVDKALAQ